MPPNTVAPSKTDIIIARYFFPAVVHNQSIVCFRSRFVVLTQIHQSFCMLNVVLMFYPLLNALFALKTYDYEQDFCLYHKMMCKAADRTLGQHFLKEFSPDTCKNSSKCEF